MDSGSIDKNSPVPYYYQLEQLLREKVENGRLKPGDALPYRENSTFWSGIPSKQTVSFSDRIDK